MDATNGMDAYIVARRGAVRATFTRSHSRTRLVLRK